MKTKPSLWWHDLANAMHKERQILEDYAFLIESGSSHEHALVRLGLSARDWTAIEWAIKKRTPATL